MVPGEKSNSGSAFFDARRTWIAFALVTAAALMLTIFRLDHDLCRGNEGLEAIFLRQMVEHGQAFPLENGQSPMYKPPLFHWTGFVLDKLRGVHQVTPFNLRLTSALYGSATVLLTMAFSYPLLGPGGAMIAGLTLLGEHQFIRLVRIGRVDATLTFFETMALFAFLWWLRALPDHKSDGRDAPGPRLYLIALALGLAVLAKGPIGALLPGLAMFLFSLTEGRLRQVVSALRPLPVLLGVAIASTWYLACYFSGEYAFLHRQFRENLGQFTGSTVGSSPPWFYIGPLLLSSLPFSLLAPAAAFFALFRNPRIATEASDRDSRRALDTRDAARLLGIFWLASLVFFSLAAYKSRWYMLPLWPPSAFLIAWGVRRCAAACKVPRLEGAFAALCGVAVVVNLITIPMEERRECVGYSYRPVAAEILHAVKPSAPLYAAGFNDEDFTPLLFYLHRDAPFIGRDLKNAPPGYIIVTRQLWDEQKDHLTGFEVVMTFDQGRRKPVLLRHAEASAGARAGT